MSWCFVQILLLLCSLSVASYRIIEYSYDDDSGSGTDTGTFLENGKKNFLLNLIAQTAVVPSSKVDEKVSTLQLLQTLNSNVKLFSENPEENVTLMPNESKKQLEDSTCVKNHQCMGTQVCNIYTRKCERCRLEKEICRRNENCCNNKKCIWGRCIHRSYGGIEGSLCNRDKDCNQGLCCAREDGQSICKKYLAEGNRCELPRGGVIFSITHSCPCSMGLNCRKTGNKSRRSSCVK